MSWRMRWNKLANALGKAGGELQDSPSDRRFRLDLLHLKRLRLVRQSGHGRGSSWALERGYEE